MLSCESNLEDMMMNRKDDQNTMGGSDPRIEDR